MQVELYNQTGEVIDKVELPDEVFALKINQDLVHQAYVTQLANSRQVLAHTKGRGEVRGGGRKPWRQKGTGRARHASIRSPIWKGGGVAFGPTKERNFKKKINNQMKKQALFMALSSKFKDKESLVLDDFKLENPKTKEANVIFKTLSAHLLGYRYDKNKKSSILFVVSGKNENLERAVNNISFVETISAKDLNVREILENKYLILLKGAVSIIGK